MFLEHQISILEFFLKEILYTYTVNTSNTVFRSNKYGLGEHIFLYIHKKMYTCKYLNVLKLNFFIKRLHI